MEQNKTKQNLTAKILILGDSSVGKSSILMRYTDNTFATNMTTTVGIDYKLKKIKVDDVELKLQIWDTAGQEKYRSLAQNYYKNSMGVLLVFDVTEEDTFDNVRNWVRQIKNHAGENICKVLLANKADLTEERVIQSEQILELAADVNMQAFECSAKTGLNIEQAFLYLAREIKKKFFPYATGSSDATVAKPEGKKLRAHDDEDGISKTKCGC